MAAAALVALVARACAIVAISRFDVLPRVARDAYHFVRVADLWATGELSVGSLDWLGFEQHRAFLIPLGIISKVTGTRVVPAQLWSALLGVVAVAVVTTLLTRVVDRRWALGGGVALALVPSQVLWSSVGIRESTIWAATAGIALLVVMAWAATGPRLLALGAGMAALLIVLDNLRVASLVVAMWALVLAAAASPGRWWRLGRVAGALALAVLVPAWLADGPLGWQVIKNHENLTGERVFNAVGADTALVEEWEPTPRVAEELGVDPGEELDIPDADDSSSTQPANGSTGAGGNDAVPSVESDADAAGNGTDPSPTLNTIAGGSAIDQLRYLPRGLAVMLFEPLPRTSFSGTSVRVAQAELLVWYPMLAFAALGFVVAIRRRLWQLAFPALVTGGLVVAYALSEGNFGTAYRHRGEFVWAIVVFAVLGAHYVVERRSGSSTAEATNG